MKTPFYHALNTQFAGLAVYPGAATLIPGPSRAALPGILKSDFLADFLKNEKIAGAVTLVAREGQVVHFAASGYADLKTRRLMKPDDFFWIASMTKPITAAAVMVLVDEGKLTLDDAVEKWLPEFKTPRLMEDDTAGQITFKQPSRPVTLRDLLRHTHGLHEEPHVDPEASLLTLVQATARKPLVSQPGTRWQYGNMGMNVLGRVVEVVAKEPFPSFLQRCFFDPLGMKETTFFPTRAQKKRLATLYAPSLTEGPLEAGEIPLIPGEITSPRRTVLPGAGLFSTAQEMLLFFQMIANGGVSGGQRYLSTDAVKAMTSTQTGHLEAGFGEGMTYGLGFNVLRDPTGYTQMLSPGSYGHDGVGGTSAWIEPRHKLVLIMMMQGDKLHRHDIHFRVRAAFHAAVSQTFGAARPV